MSNQTQQADRIHVRCTKHGICVNECISECNTKEPIKNLELDGFGMSRADPEVEELIRQSFEVIYLNSNKMTARKNTTTGDYVLPSIQDAWAGWKAGCLFMRKIATTK